MCYANSRLGEISTGQFYSNQIEHANIIFLSNVQEATEELKDCMECISRLNPYTVIYTEDFRELDGEELLAILGMTESVSMKFKEKDDEMGVMMTPMNQLFTSIVLEESDPASDGGSWHFDYTVSKQSYEKYELQKEDINRIIIIGNRLNKRELRKYIYSFGEELSGGK